MALPIISHALTFLGGLPTEPLVGLSGESDSALLASRGNDTMLVISPYPLPEEPETEIAWGYLDNIIAIAIAVGICGMTFRLTSDRRKNYGYGLCVLTEKKERKVQCLSHEKIIIITTAGCLLYVFAVYVLGVY